MLTVHIVEPILDLRHPGMVSTTAAGMGGKIGSGKLVGAIVVDAAARGSGRLDPGQGHVGTGCRSHATIQVKRYIDTVSQWASTQPAYLWPEPLVTSWLCCAIVSRRAMRQN